jgi:RNA polymerase sigma factor (sigma-70 family)
VTEPNALVDRLFRREAGRLVSALVRILGFENLELAEDIVQDTLSSALEVWKFRGVPENPAAWLVRAAKNRAVDAIRRERTARRFARDVEQLLSTEWALATTVQALFEEHEIRDDQLRLMFSCASPRLPRAAQVTVILKYLCGFGTAEIAEAFLTTSAAIEKRLARAKAVLRESGLFEVAGAARISERLDAVHGALYLMFNEGYHATAPDRAVREDLCHEAIRLATLLAEHPITGTPRSHALAALMCLHAARSPARLDAEAHFVSLEQQDRSLWDGALINRGIQQLSAARGGDISEYHIEAAIAVEHARASSFEQTDWSAIVELYDALCALKPTPVVALNRAIAVGFARGPEEGLCALAELPDRERLRGYPFLPAAEGELLQRAGRLPEARACFERARELARTPTEAQWFMRRIQQCSP